MKRFIPTLTTKQWSGLALLLALGAAGPTVIGQQSPPAAPLRQPLLDPSGYVREEAYIPAPLPDSERAYAKIEGAKMKAVVNEVVAISRQSRDAGDKYWGRIAGTKYEALTADLLEAKFRKLGMVDINRPVFDLRPQWFPLDWNVSATGGGQTLTFPSLRPALGSTATPPNGLDLDAVWVGLGTAADFQGRDVRGKAVIIHTMLAPGQMGQSAIFEGAFRRASEAGAAAILGIVPHPVWGRTSNDVTWQLAGTKRSWPLRGLPTGLGGTLPARLAVKAPTSWSRPALPIRSKPPPKNSVARGFRCCRRRAT